MVAEDIHRTIETVFRMERAKLIASLARMVRDVGQAEELAQDALVAALSDWPRNGVPRNPGAWLTATAKRRAMYDQVLTAMQDQRPIVYLFYLPWTFGVQKKVEGFVPYHDGLIRLKGVTVAKK